MCLLALFIIHPVVDTLPSDSPSQAVVLSGESSGTTSHEQCYRNTGRLKRALGRAFVIAMATAPQVEMVPERALHKLCFTPVFLEDADGMQNNEERR